MLGFALGIVRVQYRSFIGTGAKRSPAKPDPCAAWVTPTLIIVAILANCPYKELTGFDFC